MQVNSLGPVYQGRVDRFVRHAEEAKPRTHRTMVYSLQRDSFDEWQRIMDMGLGRIASGKIEKLRCLRAASSLRPNSRFRRRMYW